MKRKPLYGTSPRERREARARYAALKAAGKKVHNYRDAHDEHIREWLRQPVERVNLMSGKTFTEARGTPGYCSPASEAYWSM
jgi:hypothetical protein